MHGSIRRIYQRIYGAAQALPKWLIVPAAGTSLGFFKINLERLLEVEVIFGLSPEVLSAIVVVGAVVFSLGVMYHLSPTGLAERTKAASPAKTGSEAARIRKMRDDASRREKDLKLQFDEKLKEQWEEKRQYKKRIALAAKKLVAESRQWSFTEQVKDLLRHCREIQAWIAGSDGSVSPEACQKRKDTLIMRIEDTYILGGHDEDEWLALVHPDFLPPEGPAGPEPKEGEYKEEKAAIIKRLYEMEMAISRALVGLNE